MPKNLSPEVVAQLEPSRVVSIPGLRDTIIAIQGTSLMGPLTVVECNSWEDYVKYYGGDDANATLPNQMRQLYKQDSSATVLVHRVVHYTDLVAPTKTSVQATVDVPSVGTVASAGAVTGTVAGPWNLSPGDTLDIHVDEGAGGPETATFAAAAAAVTGTGLSITDINGETVILEMNNDGNTQTVTFTATHAGDPDGAIAEMNAQLTGCSVDNNGGQVRITSDLYGTDSEIDITGGTALTELGLSVGVTTEATSDVANIDAVTFTEAKTIIEADVTHESGLTVTEHASGYLIITSNTTGASSSIQVEVSSTAHTAFGLDNTKHDGSASSSVTTIKIKGKYDGEYAHDLRGIVEDSSNGDSSYFNLRVTDDEGNFKEVFPDVQVATPANDDYVETVVNKTPDTGGSRYFEIEDQLQAVRPANGTYTPAGGDNGLTSLADTDFIGDKAGATGLYAYDNIQDITVIADGGRATAAYSNAMTAYAQTELDGWCAVIHDMPAGYTAAQAVSYVATLTVAQQSAIAWPRMKILNPSKAIYGNTDQLTIALSGSWAGIYSRRAAEQLGGIHQAPAGLPFQGLLRGAITGCVALETNDVLDKAKRNVVYPKRINPLNFGGGTYYVDGSRGLDAQGQFPTIGEWLGTVFIVRSLLAGFEFAKHMANDEDLWALMRRTGRLFLLGQMRLGAFKSKTDESQAFFIEVNEALNPPSVVEQEKVFFRVGLAKAKPASFVNLLVSKDTRALENEISG